MSTPKYLPAGHALNQVVKELRALRVARGWSLNTLERRGGRKAVVYRSWEAGDRNCTVKDVIEWAAIFGKRPALVDIEGVRVTRSKDEVIASLRQLASDLEVTMPSVVAHTVT